MLGRQRDPEELRARLERWLAPRLPHAEVAPLATPKAGVSNETFVVEVAWRDRAAPRRERLVLRLEPCDFLVFPTYDLPLQARVMQAVGAAGVPVPRVRWVEHDPAPLGGAFYVMDLVEGRVPPEVPSYHVLGWVRDAEPERRARLWWSGVEAMARIHALDWRALGLDALGDPGAGTGPIDRQLDWWARYLAWGTAGGPAQPVLAAALAWLRDRRYAPRRTALCWGDARMPNLLFGDDGVAAVLDWEMAFVGDPGADVGWWCFLDWANTEGWGAPHLDGIPGRDETLARYAVLSGHPVEHPEWQEVFAALRYGALLARVGARLKAIGASVPTPDFETNNPCTQALARLLDLAPPGAVQAATTLATRGGEAEVRLQLHLAGEGGGDWWVSVRNGVATRHAGTAPTADAVLRADVADWRAVQTGALDRLAAFLDGKIRIEGDPTLFMVHEATVTRLAGEFP